MRWMVLFVSVGLGLACGQGAEWKPYTHAETGFSARFPGTPMETSKVDTSDLGNIQVYQVELQAGSEPLRYRVRADDFPLSYIDFFTKMLQREPEALILARKGQYEVDIAGKTLEEGTITQDGHSGYRFTFKWGDGSIEYARLFVVGTILYHASVIVPPAAERRTRPEVARFLDGLQLREDPEFPSQPPQN